MCALDSTLDSGMKFLYKQKPAVDLFELAGNYDLDDNKISIFNRYDKKQELQDFYLCYDQLKFNFASLSKQKVCACYCMYLVKLLLLK